MLDRESRARAREIVRKIIATPTLPILGITKVFEAIVSSGELWAWTGFTVLASLGYVFADNLSEAADDVME